MSYADYTRHRPDEPEPPEEAFSKDWLKAEAGFIERRVKGERQLVRRLPPIIDGCDRWLELVCETNGIFNLCGPEELNALLKILDP